MDVTQSRKGFVNGTTMVATLPERTEPDIERHTGLKDTHDLRNGFG